MLQLYETSSLRLRITSSFYTILSAKIKLFFNIDLAHKERYSMIAQTPYFDVKDQDETYEILVEHMIYELTRDFRLTKRRL